MITALVRNRWALVPVVLIGATIAFTSLTVVLAVSDHPLGIEPQYDTKAALWQQTASQRADNDRLRWLATPQLTRLDTGLVGLRLRIEDRHAIAIAGGRVSVECIPVAAADDRCVIELPEIGAGEYAAAFAPRLGGLHEFRVEVLRDGQRWTDQFRRSIPHSDMGAP